MSFVVPVLLNGYNTVNSVLYDLIAKLNITPQSYLFMFPPRVDPTKIAGMVTEGIFPTLPDLAPALTIFAILSIGRLVLQYLFIRVSLNHFPGRCAQLTSCCRSLWHYEL